MRDGIINYSGFLVSGIIGLILVPFLLRGLGKEAYGLWIAALAIAAIPGVLELGVSFSIRREVSALGGEASEETTRFVASAGSAYLGLGVLGAASIGFSGPFLSRGLHLTAATQGIAASVFAAVALGFIANQMVVYATAILVGLQRFGALNLITIFGAIVRAIGIIALLWAGKNVVWVATWQAGIGGLMAAAGLVLVVRLQPQYRLRLDWPDWSSLRPHLPFGFASLLSTLASKLLWESGTVLIGFIMGSAQVVPYYIGQKFPTAVSFFGWRLAEVLFPAASEYERKQDLSRTREVLEVGTRWVMVLVVPICIVLWVIAPNLLHAWLGEVQPEAVSVLRLTAAAILVDSLGVSSLHVLWGRGAARTVLAVLGGSAAANIVLSIWLLGRVGVTGPAWALLCVLSVGALGFLVAAKHACGVNLNLLLRRAVIGLLVPAAACTIVVWASDYYLQPERWPGVILVAAAGAAAYSVVLYFFGSKAEEKKLLQDMLRLPGAGIYWVYRRARGALRGVRAMRSAWYFLHELTRPFWDTPVREVNWFDAEFQVHPDPWQYGTPAQQERLLRSAEMLDAVRGNSRFHSALEIGCGEGWFTELLAPRCEALLALDFSAVALGRARSRFSGQNHVRFAQWDLYRDPLPGSYDLVLVMGVLEDCYRRRDLRRARAKIVGLIVPGGYLLVSSTRREVLEEARWGRWLIRGARWLNAFVGEHPSLRVVSSSGGEFYLNTLFKKEA